jgi:hypothetical protein
MRKFISLFLSGALSVSGIMSGAVIPFAAKANETNGFSVSEIESSSVKPKLFITVDGVRAGKVFDLGDVAGKTVEVALNVEGADMSYASTGIHIYYDKALTLPKNSLGNLAVKYGDAVMDLSHKPAVEDTTASKYNSNMKGFFVATAGYRNLGADGVMWTFDLEVPADAKAGDVFPIDIFYREKEKAADLFLNVKNDNAGRIMQAYTFTRGIYNKNYNNRFAASSEDVAECAALADIDKSYDGYIAIADFKQPVTTTTTTTTTTAKKTTTTTTKKSTTTTTSKKTTTTTRLTTTTTKKTTTSAKPVTTTTTTKKTTSVTTSKLADTRFGDANIDGKVSVADAVAILQHLGNRDKYGLKAQGMVNADVDGKAGVTGNDALVLQKVDAGIIKLEELPLK